ncbi:LLM class flavin-dependent oxidoreductase [Chromobacterium sp. ASV23]|uniref:LLM class flavin-dependent oxidoreductase n=1 Tax=Chromobacterium sp. ASV23 TaxID=2795110 RepID=UPI0018ECA664|nr:LLM class flavin-dependent oxidoreductase [Chromobacterium sp. ASV23]
MSTKAMLNRKPNPLFVSQNKMKLGVFGLNIDGGCTFSAAPERLAANDWTGNLEVAKLADAAGLEALVPVGRWRGFGGKSNPEGLSYETYAWAAGMAALTDQIAIMATSHLSTVHPLFAAKQAMTIDHISGGRFGLNMICGWFTSEMGMFNGVSLDNEARYAQADEWLHVVQKAWGDPGEFNFNGQYFTLTNAVSDPKPLNRPFLMNAGGSPRGKRFCAQHCDAAYLILKHEDGDDAIRDQIRSYRDLARIEFGRDLKIWCYAYVVQRDSLEEAEKYLDYYVNQMGDDEACSNITRELGINTGMFGSTEEAERFRYHIKAGFAGVPLIGTPEMIVEQFKRYSELGVDGICLTWLDYHTGLKDFVRDVLPLMEQEGLRAPFTPETTLIKVA